MIDAKALSGPVPGQSLTSTPNNAAWERPPEIAKPEEAAKYHLNRIDELTTEVLDALELGVDVKTLTEGILRGAVAEGVHSIDVSLIIAPLIHEKITGIADGAGIEYDEGTEVEDDRGEVKRLLGIKEANKVDLPLEEEVVIEEETKPTGDGFMQRRS